MIHSWWHKFLRRRTKPIPVDEAIKWKRIFSIGYGLLAWNAFGLVAYMVVSGKADWAHYYGLKSDEEKAVAPARAFAATLGIPNAKVYRVSGFTKVFEYDIVNGEEVIPKEKEDEEIHEIV